MKRFSKALAAVLGVFLGSATLAFAAAYAVGVGGTGWTNIKAHTVLLGNGSGQIATTSPSTSGYVLTSNGVSADPTFQAPAVPSLSATYPIQYSGGVISTAFSTTTANTYTGLQTIPSNKLTLTGLSDGCAQIASGQFTSTGSACGTGSGGISSVSADYPLTGLGTSGSHLALAFGTTTANTWSALQTFSYASSTAFSASGTIYAANFVDTSFSGNACIGESSGVLGQATNCVSSIASAGGTLTISSPTGNVDASLNLAHANTWSALQQFANATTTQLTATDAWITKLRNLTSNGFIKTSGGDGTLSVDTTTYLSSAVQTLVLPQGSFSGNLTIATTSNTTNGITSTLTAVGSGSTITLSSNQSGTLTVAGGGTGAATFTGSQLLYGAGTGAFQSVATSSASCSSGVSCSSFTVVGSVSPSITNSGVLSLAQTYGTAQTGALTIATSTATTFNGLTTGMNITNSSGAFTFTQTLSGTLGVGGGGTGQSSFTSSNLLYGAGSGAIQSVATTTPSCGGTLTCTNIVTLASAAGIPALVLNLANANTWTAAQTFNIGAGSPGILTNSLVGIGTTTPKWALQVASSTGPQITISDPSSFVNNHWSFRNAGGNLYISTSSANTYATSTNTSISLLPGGLSGFLGISTTTPTNPLTLPAGTVSLPAESWGDTATGIFRSALNAIGWAINGVEKMTLNSTGLGVSSTTPYAALSVGTGTASSTIAVAEYTYGANGNLATSTTATIDARVSTQVQWPIGTSATTLTICNMVPGQTLRVRVVNPNGTAGALTWAVCSGSQLQWVGKSTPTQTTTANDWDIWSFVASYSVASSTNGIIMISGAQSAGF